MRHPQCVLCSVLPPAYRISNVNPHLILMYHGLQGSTSMTSHCKLDTTRPFMSDIATPILFLKIQLHHATDVNRGLFVKNIGLPLMKEISK